MAETKTIPGQTGLLAGIARRGSNALTRRFPLAAACVVATAVIAAHRVMDIPILDGGPLDAHLTSLAAIGVLAALAGALIAEGFGWSKMSGLWIGIGLLALVAARHAITDPDDPSTLLFLAPAMVLLCSAAAYTRTSDQAYWSAHLTVAQGFVLACVCGVVLAGSLAALGLALDVLFKVEVTRHYYSMSWVLGMVLLAPLALLAAIPNPETVREPPRWTRWAALGLLLPIAIIYLLVVYGYGVSILLQWELPRGRVAPVVGGFAAFAIAVYVAIYPWRRQKVWVQRTVFALLAAPAALLATAVYRRIEEYGLTEERALLAVIAAWLAVMAVAHVIGRPRLPALAVSLALMMALASTGPWGANALSARDQLAKLTAMLEEHGRLVDGQVVKSEAEMEERDANEIHSLLHYLNRTGNWDAAARLAPEASTEADKRIESFLVAGGVPVPLIWADESGIQGFRFADAGAHATAGFPLVAALPLWPHDLSTIEGPEGAIYEVKIEREDGLVRITTEDKRQVEFNLGEMVKSAVSSESPGGHPMGDAANETGTFRVRLLLQGAFGRLERYGPDLHDALLLILISDTG